MLNLSNHSNVRSPINLRQFCYNRAMTQRAAPFDRETTLDRALALFWRKGYHATSLKDLEAALSLKPGSIYAAFTNKETLFRTVLARYADNSTAGLTALLARHDSPIAALQDYALSLADLSQQPPSRACMLVKTLLETGGSDPELHALAQDHLDAVQSVMEQAFVHARASGEIPATADPHRLARYLQSSIIGLRVLAQRDPDPVALRELATDIAADLGTLRQLA